MIRIQKHLKLFLMLFVLVFLMSGCTKTEDDPRMGQVTSDLKDPTDTNDPVDTEDPIVDNKDAVNLVVDVLLDGVCNGEGEAYSLVIFTSDYYSISSIGDLDLEATLSTNAGAFLAYNDNRSSVDDNFEILKYLEPGTYLVGVSAAEGTTSGTYQLVAQKVVVTHTSTITKNTMISDSVLKSESNTVEFNVSSDGDVQLYTDSIFDTYGTVYDANGNVVAENDNGQGETDFYIDVFLVAGTYFVEISATGDFEIAEYLLLYDFLDDVAIYETVALDGFATGVSIGYVTGYFELTISQAVTVNVYSVSDYDLEGEIYISKTAMVPFDYNDDGGADYNFLMDNIALDPGVYYIHVFALESNVTYYEIHVDTVE